MNVKELTNRQLAVINALEKEHLTSFQILNKLNNISLILIVYTILDELKKMGILKSYFKKDMQYHYINIE